MLSFPKDKPKDALKVTYPNRGTIERCHWLFEKDGTYRCRIHPMRSITCGMPHLRFFYTDTTHTTSLGLSQYGRNWALQCPVSFGKVDEQSVFLRTIWLGRLLDTAKDMDIETYLPEILRYLEFGRVSHKFELKSRRKLF
jgi:hypothetical protein